MLPRDPPAKLDAWCGRELTGLDVSEKGERLHILVRMGLHDETRGSVGAQMG